MPKHERDGPVLRWRSKSKTCKGSCTMRNDKGSCTTRTRCKMNAVLKPVWELHRALASTSHAGSRLSALNMVSRFWITTARPAWGLEESAPDCGEGVTFFTAVTTSITWSKLFPRGAGSACLANPSRTARNLNKLRPRRAQTLKTEHGMHLPESS